MVSVPASAPFAVLAEGLGHPEGPDLLPDGRLIAVETYRSRLITYDPGRGVETYAECGGGPNACVLGRDGAVYLTQNGGQVGPWRSHPTVQPGIQRAWPDGSVETVCTAVDGIELRAPNDLSFGPDGWLYFTDPGDWNLDNRPHLTEHGFSYVFGISPDGDARLIARLDDTYPNGILAEADGSVVWVESYPRAVRRQRPGGQIEDLCVLPEGHQPDGLKADREGNLWITVFGGAGLDVVAPDGTFLGHVSMPGTVTLNCIFDSTGLWVCDFGPEPADMTQPALQGRLLHVPLEARGAPLFRSSITPRPVFRSH